MFVVVIISKGGTTIAHIRFNTLKAAEECQQAVNLFEGLETFLIEDVRQ